MSQIREWIRREELTQAEAAERLEVHQPRVSSLMAGHLDKFSIDALVAMAARAGLEIEVTLKVA
jgi:predicted XRE-type DNA-binding protein